MPDDASATSPGRGWEGTARLLQTDQLLHHPRQGYLCGYEQKGPIHLSFANSFIIKKVINGNVGNVLSKHETIGPLKAKGGYILATSDVGLSLGLFLGFMPTGQCRSAIDKLYMHRADCLLHQSATVLLNGVCRLVWM